MTVTDFFPTLLSTQRKAAVYEEVINKEPVFSLNSNYPLNKIKTVVIEAETEA